MRLSALLETAAGVAQVGEPLWNLIRDEAIASEDERKLMLREVFRHEIESGRVGEGEVEAKRFRALRHLLRTAPIGVQLSELEIDGQGRAISSVLAAA